jgi:hypothetical protein
MSEGQNEPGGRWEPRLPMEPLPSGYWLLFLGILLSIAAAVFLFALFDGR